MRRSQYESWTMIREPDRARHGREPLLLELARPKGENTLVFNEAGT
jgi:hypothetical protein